MQSHIFLVVYRFSHHYSISGYNRLTDFIPCSKIAVPKAMEPLLKAAASLRGKTTVQQETGLTGYFAECSWLEWYASLVRKMPMRSIVHFIYPENSYYYTASRTKGRRAKTVATYHQPVKESRQFILKTDAIRRLDAVILLSETQREFFEPLLDRDRIFVVPHGIDLDFFSPSPDGMRERRIISVGNWLRDFDTLVGALRILETKTPDLACDVVTLEHNKSRFDGLRNVRFHAGISDGLLRNLYQHASLSVLSLTGAAANNALLESLASGLPIVATDLPAVREYTTAEGSRYAPSSNPRALADEIMKLIDDKSTLERMGQANRIYATRFAWTTIARRTMEVYEAVEQMESHPVN